MFEKKPTSPDKATNIAVTEYSDILQGRRIIDLGYFAKMIVKNHCNLLAVLKTENME